MLRASVSPRGSWSTSCASPRRVKAHAVYRGVGGIPLQNANFCWRVPKKGVMQRRAPSKTRESFVLEGMQGSQSHLQTVSYMGTWIQWHPLDRPPFTESGVRCQLWQGVNPIRRQITLLMMSTRNKNATLRGMSSRRRASFLLKRSTGTATVQTLTKSPS